MTIGEGDEGGMSGLVPSRCSDIAMPMKVSGQGFDYYGVVVASRGVGLHSTITGMTAIRFVLSQTLWRRGEMDEVSQAVM